MGRRHIRCRSRTLHRPDVIDSAIVGPLHSIHGSHDCVLHVELHIKTSQNIPGHACKHLARRGDMGERDGGCVSLANQSPNCRRSSQPHPSFVPRSVSSPSGPNKVPVSRRHPVHKAMILHAMHATTWCGRQNLAWKEGRVCGGYAVFLHRFLSCETWRGKRRWGEHVVYLPRFEACVQFFS
jgi:hypothetical protein